MKSFFTIILLFLSCHSFSQNESTNTVIASGLCECLDSSMKILSEDLYKIYYNADGNTEELQAKLENYYKTNADAFPVLLNEQVNMIMEFNKCSSEVFKNNSELVGNIEWELKLIEQLKGIPGCSFAGILLEMGMYQNMEIKEE